MNLILQAKTHWGLNEEERTKLARREVQTGNMWLVEPALKVLNQNDEWIVRNPGLYRLNGELIPFYEGFITDLASIPRWARAIIPVNGKHRLAAILHDKLYKDKGKVGQWQYSRKQCDLFFLAEMKQQRVRRIKRRIMYRAVRLGGGFYWSKNK